MGEMMSCAISPASMQKLGACRLCCLANLEVGVYVVHDRFPAGGVVICHIVDFTRLWPSHAGHEHLADIMRMTSGCVQFP